MMDESIPRAESPAPPALPPQPPPVIVPPSPPPPPRRGRGWMVVALILLILLVISGLYNLGSFTSSILHTKGKYAHTSGPRLEEVVTEDKNENDKIVVIAVDGIITSRVVDQGGFSLVDVIKAQLKRAEEDSKVKAVILKVDSPGGEVLASDEIYNAIKDFQDKARKPVVASMGNLAASGGYYISAPCQWIVANDLTITGSIGVIMHSWNYRGLMNKVGLRPETYKSGRFKDMLSGERDPDLVTEDTKEEHKMVQDLIDETFHKFKDVVKEGRQKAYERNKKNTDGKTGQELSEDWQDYADGRVLSGTQALKLGFVSQLGSFEVAVARAKSVADISGAANLVEYQQRYDISDIFRMFGQSESRVVKWDP